MLGATSDTSKMFKYLRWLFLLVFPVSCIPLLTHHTLAPFVFFGALLSTLSCALLLRNIRTISPFTLPVLLVLGLCVGMYFLRYVYFSYFPQAAAGIQPDIVFKAFRGDVESLQTSYIWTAFFFSLFCFVAAGLLVLSTQNQIAPASGVRLDPSPKSIWIMMLIIISVMVLLGYIAYLYRIGQMGAPPGPALPFRAKGIVFYGRQVVLPLLILYVIAVGTRLNNRWVVLGGILLLITHAVSDMFLRGSRSSLLLCALMLFFLMVSGGIKIRRLGLSAFVVGGLTAIWLMPTIMNYRILRFTSTDNIYLIMAKAFSGSSEGGLAQLFRALTDLYLRIPGIETLWAMSSLSATPLDGRLFEVIRSSFGVTGYLNFDVYRISPEWYTLFAPGYIGWWYLAAGWLGLSVGAFLLAIFCVQAPRWIQLARLDCQPVANVFLLWILFISFSDGTLDGNFLLIFSGVVTLACLEGSIRLIGRYSNQKVG